MSDFIISILVWFGLEPLAKKMGLFENFEAGEARFDSKTGEQIKK